ncbi:filamentous hemagglutinin N-terminal domain-containing protein [Mitsuaria sp. 7]|uniref:two-partner secretion domain-containing protein n=1 Tax=Mitsuaria sp. 7 TaxID=1658665 RepID=UPI0007DD3063|nr:filamentous hemagglutinin N-terminal domain-containing protein [Mitsuaria sp. 7]ANH66481.1 hypothetical protein ABE85_00935 [Mitsuaria sp. 7]
MIDARMTTRRRSLTAAMAAAGLLMLAGEARSQLPQGHTVRQGEVDVQVTGQAMTITQTSAAAKLDWQSFDIGRDHAVRIEQPTVDAFLVNRVTGSTQSWIDGALTAKGRVFLINPNGVMFGSTAAVDVGGLVAAGMRLSDEQMRDALAPGLSTLAGDSQVANVGSIVVREGGVATFAADRVQLDGRVDVSRSGALIVESGTSVEISRGVRAGRSIQIRSAASLAVSDGAGHNRLSSRKIQSWLDAGAQVQLTSDRSMTVDGTVEADGAATAGLSLEATGGDIEINSDILVGAGDVAMKVGPGRIVMAEGTEIRTGDGKVSFVALPLNEPTDVVVRLSRVHAPELMIDIPGFAYFEPFEKDFDGSRHADPRVHYSGAFYALNEGSNLRAHSNTYEFADPLPGKNKVINGVLRLTGFNGDATTAIPLRAHGEASIRGALPIAVPEGSVGVGIDPPATDVDVEIEPTPPIVPPISSTSSGSTSPDVPEAQTGAEAQVMASPPPPTALPARPETPASLEIPIKADRRVDPAMPVEAKSPPVAETRSDTARMPLAVRRAIGCEERRGVPMAATCERAAIPTPVPAAPGVFGGIRLPAEASIPAPRR